MYLEHHWLKHPDLKARNIDRSFFILMPTYYVTLYTGFLSSSLRSHLSLFHSTIFFCVVLLMHVMNLKSYTSKLWNLSALNELETFVYVLLSSIFIVYIDHKMQWWIVWITEIMKKKIDESDEAKSSSNRVRIWWLIKRIWFLCIWLLGFSMYMYIYVFLEHHIFFHYSLIRPFYKWCI